MFAKNTSKHGLSCEDCLASSFEVLMPWVPTSPGGAFGLHLLLNSDVLITFF